MAEYQVLEVHGDGSITIEADGKKAKFVLESDLGAVKAALKGKDDEITKLQSTLATTNTKLDEEHQSVLKERAAKEQFETVAGESATHKQKVEDLTKEMAGIKTTSGELEQKLTGYYRSQLVDGYKVEADKIKDKGLSDLETMVQTFSTIGYKPAAANYDGKGGGGGSPSNLAGKNPMELFRLGYAQSK